METLFNVGCKACPLDKAKGLKHPKMEATGSKKPLIYVLGEAPGKEEDKLGRQFVGKSGMVLRKYLPEELLPRIRWNNVLNCHPEGNETPTPVQIMCCRSRVETDIEKSKPKAIFCFGSIPLKWTIDENMISSWRGLRVPVKIGSHCCWAYYFYHPSYLARNRRKNPKTNIEMPSEFEKFFERDIEKAIGELDDIPDAVVVEGDEIKSGITIITGENGWNDVKLIKKKLKQFSKLPEVAFDYETATDETSRDRQVRPYGKNARILSISVGTFEDTIAFPIRHREAQWTKDQLAAVEEAWGDFLKTDTQKIAHHLFFEVEWSVYFFGVDKARACTWDDTMAQVYVLGRQRGTTSLDSITLINFGFHLKVLSNVNRSDLDHEPLDKVLLYNGMDTKWTHANFLVQRDEIEYQNLEEVYEDQVRRTPTLVLKSYFGMLIDFDAVVGFDIKYGPRIRKLEKWFQNSSAAKKFEERMGRIFKPASPQDVLLLLRNVLGRKECKIEDKKEKGKDKWSTEDQVLEKIPLTIATKLQEYRAVRGNKSKYVDNLIPKNYNPKVLVSQKGDIGKCVFPDGLTHAVVQHQILVTHRTSCHFPNEQFWPKRDEGYVDLRSLFAAPNKEMMRKLASSYDYNFPSHLNEDDCYFVTIDFGQIQARIAGMLSEDRLYCTYLWDRNDIHMRWTENLARAYPSRIGGKAFLKDKDALRKFRTDVKNQWTFPLIFGATANSVSNYLNIPVEVLRPQIRQFFREMPGLANYQKRTRQLYEERGYVEGPTGWRRYGPLDHGEVINTPIQNAEAEIVLDAMTRLSEAAQELDSWQFQARLEVHDELGFWIPKKNVDRDIEFIANEMLLCEHFPWINVPLCIEIGKGDNWYTSGLKENAVAVLYSDDFDLLNRKECGF